MSFCGKVMRKGQWTGRADAVVLDYDGRFLRRRRLVMASGDGFLVDLPETVSMFEGDAFLLSDGRLVAVKAAQEPVVVIRGDLPRLAWHIGNRHTPCEIAGDHLVIRRDHVIEAMLAHLGAQMSHEIRPFRPEGGAYGHGRTLGHDHGNGEGQAPGHTPGPADHFLSHG